MFLWEIACLFSLMLLLVAAATVDLRERRIPNEIVLAGIALGFAAQLLAPEGQGLLADFGWGSLGALPALYGLLMGLGLLLPIYLLGAMGAGDVKLMAMLGVWFGPEATFWLAMLTLLSGGVLALGAALWTRTLRQTFSNLRFIVFDSLLRVASGGSVRVSATATHGRLPYSLAIATGTLLEVAYLKGWVVV